MGIFDGILGQPENDERDDDALSGRNIAVGRAEFRGSVHSGGDVDVTVETQYGDRGSSAISLEASVHGTGNEDLTVERVVDFEEVPDDWLPDSPAGAGEGRPVHRRIDEDGSVHSYGRLDYHIDRLVIVPDVSGQHSFQAEGNDRWLRAFQKADYKTAQELSVNGSVHDRGTLSVTIDNLVVME